MVFLGGATGVVLARRDHRRLRAWRGQHQPSNNLTYDATHDHGAGLDADVLLTRGPAYVCLALAARAACD
jgi:hypothetical protein